MQETIEKLLILQDRDRKIQRVQAEMRNIDPERADIQSRLVAAQAALDAVKLQLKHNESDRKKLELEVEAKKQQIEKYSLQQFQTKKNDEYRALAHEIEHCKAAIVQLEDQELELMERADVLQKEATRATQTLNETKKTVEQLTGALAQKETALKGQLGELEANYDGCVAGIDEGALSRYHRLRKTKGESVVVGIEHSVCGGCHMRLPPHIVISCQAQHEIVSCPNCARILYYAQYMDLVATE